MRLDGLSEYFETLGLEDYLLLAAVILLPWAFGGVEIWAYRSASLLLAGAAAVALGKRGLAGLGLGRGAGWLLPAFLLAAWAGFQLLPLPPAAVRVLSPRAHVVYTETFPGYPAGPPADIPRALERDALARVPETPQFREAEGETAFRMELDGDWDGWRPLSLQPDATIERLFWFLALLCGFLVARKRAIDPDRARVYRTVAFGLFTALALQALLQEATWNGEILWLRRAPERTDPFGPYVNFIHFAGVMELAVPWLAGYAWTKFQRPEGETLWRSIAPVALGITLLCFVTALMAASKGAALLILVALTLLGLSRRPRSLRVRVAVIVSVVVMWGVSLALAVWMPLGERLEQFWKARGVDRFQAWKTGLDALGDFLVTGCGFGSFREVFPAYLPAGEWERWLQLHNDYLEVLLEGGLVGGVLILWLAWGWLRRSLRVFRAPGGERDLEAVGLFLGVAALMVHAAADFNHQIPANALLWVFAAGVLVARGEGDTRAGGGAR